MSFTSVRKRDGRTDAFEAAKITRRATTTAILYRERAQRLAYQLTELSGESSAGAPASTRTLVKLNPRRTAHFAYRRPDEKRGSGFFRSAPRSVSRPKVQLHLPLLPQPATGASFRGALGRTDSPSLPAPLTLSAGRGGFRRVTGHARLGRIVQKIPGAGLKRQAGYQRLILQGAERSHLAPAHKLPVPGLQIRPLNLSAGDCPEISGLEHYGIHSYPETWRSAP